MDVLTPMKAIRAKCLDCSAGSANEVKLCPVTRCPLYLFRFGKNPNIQLTAEQKVARAANFQKIPSQQGDSVGNSLTEGNYTPATQNAAESHPAPYKESPLHQPAKTSMQRA